MHKPFQVLEMKKKKEIRMFFPCLLFVLQLVGIYRSVGVAWTPHFHLHKIHALKL